MLRNIAYLFTISRLPVLQNFRQVYGKNKFGFKIVSKAKQNVVAKN